MNQYPLDNSAIVHLAVNNRKITNTYRITMTLAQPIQADVLRTALETVCPRFPTIAACIREGFFHHRVVPVPSAVQLEPDPGLLFGMSPEQIRKCALRVYYRENQVSIEVFHSLSDGYGGFAFLRSLLGEYLRLLGRVDREELTGVLLPGTPVEEAETEDSFLRHAGPGHGGLPHKPAYQLFPEDQGKPIRRATVLLDSQSILDAARGMGTTVTSLLTTVMADSVMELQKQLETTLMPVNVMVPVDLRKRFDSRTLRNFSLFASPRLLPGEEALPLEDQVERIHRQLEDQLSTPSLQAMISTNVNMQGKWFFAWLPLGLKCLCLKLGYHFFGSGNSSISLSNLGNLQMPEAMKPHITRVDCFLTPRYGGAYNCCLISYRGKLTITFTRRCEEPALEKIFLRRLREIGLNPALELGNAQ